MGDYDSELYNTANQTYNEVVNIYELLKDLNKNVRDLVVEIKGLRGDLRTQ